MARRPGVSWLVCFLFFSTVASSCAGQQLANQPRETFRTAETVHGQAPLNKTTSAGLRRAQMLEMFARGYFPGRTGQLMIDSAHSPVTYISAEEGAAVEKTPGDTARGWDLWKRKALGQ